MSKRHLAVTSSIAGLIVNLVVFVPSVSASNFGSTPAAGNPTNQVSLANGAHHTVELDNVTPLKDNAIRWALDNAYDPTQMSTEIVGSTADVRVEDENYGDNGVYGWVNCPDGASETGSNPNRTCHGQVLKWNLYNGYDNANDTVSKRHSRACHELGHTVGLQHNSNTNSCMEAPYSWNRAETLSNHDEDHVNSEY